MFETSQSFPWHMGKHLGWCLLAVTPYCSECIEPSLNYRVGCCCCVFPYLVLFLFPSGFGSEILLILWYSRIFALVRESILRCLVLWPLTSYLFLKPPLLFFPLHPPHCCFEELWCASSLISGVALVLWSLQCVKFRPGAWTLMSVMLKQFLPLLTAGFSDSLMASSACCSYPSSYSIPYFEYSCLRVSWFPSILVSISRIFLKRLNPADCNALIRFILRLSGGYISFPLRLRS